MPALLYLIAALAVGLALGAAIASYRGSRRTDAVEAELSIIREQRDKLAADLVSASNYGNAAAERAARAEGQLEATLGEYAKSDHTISDLNLQLRTLRQQLAELSIAAEGTRTSLSSTEETLRRALQDVASKDAVLEASRAELQTVKEELAQAKANLVHSERANQDIKGFLNDAQTKLGGLFVELAGETFGKKAEVFEKNVKEAGDKSKSDIGLLLEPFAQRIVEFRQRVETLYSEEARDRSSLQGAVTELKTLNQDMADKAAALTRALKGNAKIRGDWGELMLETVLGACGLQEGRHYDRQKSSADDEGQRLRPDIVVRLPNDRKVVIDSKVSLLSWIDATNAETPEAHKEALRNHTVSMRQHVRDLGDKNYPKTIGASALEVTVAFVPIEGALSAALDAAPDLQLYAFERRVVFASPNTLMALLGVVERLWTREKIQRRVDEVGRLGGKVVDALVKFLEDFERIGTKMINAQDAFNDAKKSLNDSNQALLPRARRLLELGVRGKKALPEELQPDLIEQAEDDKSTSAAALEPVLMQGVEGADLIGS